MEEMEEKVNNPGADLESVQEVSSPLRKRFRSAYWQVMRDVDTHRLLQWENARLTLPKLRMMLEVWHAPGITIGQLAKCTGVTISTASTLVKQLVERGLITRDVDERDRRQTHLIPSQGGQVVGSKIRKGSARTHVEALADEVGGDLEEITAALEMLVEAGARIRTRER